MSEISLEKKGFWAYAALGFGVLCLGFSAIFIRWADAPGPVTAFYRMGIGAGVMFLPFLMEIRNQKEALDKAGLILAICGGIFFGCDLTLWTTGIVMSGATGPTIMTNIAPIFVGLGSLLLFRERQVKKFWIGLLLALLGAVLVLGLDWSRAPEFGQGTLLGLLAAIFYGGYQLVSQPGRAKLSTIKYFWISTFSSTMFLLIVNLLMNNSIIGYSKNTYWVFAGVGIVVQILGWVSINFAQGYLPASIVAPSLLGQPVLTAIIAGIFLGEMITIWHGFGGILVLIGVYLVHRSKGNLISQESIQSG